MTFALATTIIGPISDARSSLVRGQVAMGQALVAGGTRVTWKALDLLKSWFLRLRLANVRLRSGDASPTQGRLDATSAVASSDAITGLVPWQTWMMGGGQWWHLRCVESAGPREKLVH